MKIVHYTLGIYPKRAGGLNRYATDLMFEQSRNHEVSVLVPGVRKLWFSTCVIKKKGTIKGLHCYKLDNALPLPLLYGVRTPRDFWGRKISEKSFECFWHEVRPDVLHLHTLMGMPEDALRFFKEKGVKIVYTSHDYFGICPKVNLIDQEGKLCEGPNPEHCAICNEGAASTFFLRMRNSAVALTIRDAERWLKSILNF